MNLLTKFVYTVSGATLAVLVISETIRQRHDRSALREVSQANLQRLETATWNNLRNLQRSVNAALRDAMETGEMDRLAKTLNHQREIEGLLECSLVGTAGRVAYSSHPDAVKRSLEPDLKSQLFSRTNAIERQTSDAFEVYLPLVAAKACVECHTDWKEGQVAGVQMLRVSNADYRNAQQAWQESSARMAHDTLWVGVMVAVGLLGVLIVLLTFMVRWLLVRPLFRTTEFLDGVSRGDLTQDVPKELSQRQDEIGHLARSLESMTRNLRGLLHDVAQGVHTLVSSASGLSTVSENTITSVKAVSDRAATVAAAAEESSANTASVASSTEKASANLADVATATEEICATVSEIASSSEKAREISAQASGQVQTITSLMEQLGQAAQEIGQVTATINAISSQTNLLALNATIEAARAGAAGKGFAVVANEIKELARQTAAATEDIKARVNGVQTSTGSAVADIEKITAIIQDVGQLVAGIASALEEQAAVTKNVAGNIAQASDGVEVANQRVAETATVARSIAQDIATVNQSVGDIRRGGEAVQRSAEQLTQLAGQLRGQLSQFRLPDRPNAGAPSVVSVRETEARLAA